LLTIGTKLSRCGGTSVLILFKWLLETFRGHKKV
jgi:hypothetical protein